MSNFGKRLRSAGQITPPERVGDPWQGGFYAGQISVGGTTWGLVVAPRATGYTETQPMNTATGVNTTAFSRWDGVGNMDLMVGAAWPAANWARGLTIGGFSDWHLPAEDQLDLCYRSFRPVNAPNTSWGENPSMVPPKGNYTSTDPAATTVPAFMAGGEEDFTANVYAVVSPGTTATTHRLINFNGGVRMNGQTNANRMWRAVRMVRIG